MSLVFLMAPAREKSGYRVFDVLPAENLNNVRVVSHPSGKRLYQLTDTTLEGRGNSLHHDLVLSLNDSAESLRKDDSGKYKIKSAGYLSARVPGTFGDGCAKFFRTSHRIVIDTEETLWLGRCGDLGSFTMEFRFRPITLTDRMEIFSRRGYLSGSLRGMEAVIVNRHLSFRFYQVFEDSKGNRHDIIISSRQKLFPGRWYHAALSFNRLTGKLALYLNGSENNTRYVTEDGRPGGQVLVPSFGKRNREGNLACIESPPAVIGNHFSGYLDEFRITFGDISLLRKKSHLLDRPYHPVYLKGRQPFNREGIITSPVYPFPDTGTRVLLFTWKEKIPKDTFIWMEFRMADHLFYAEDEHLPWYRVKRNQRNIHMKKVAKGRYLRGKYYQWRAHLIASPGGRCSPLLHDVALRYQVDPPPAVPLFPEIIRAGDKKVVLRWRKNSDADLKGYRVHYGIVPGRFDGIISYLKGKAITNTLSSGDYVEITIDNSIIEENRKRDPRRILDFPRLKNTVLYYFGVTAYDRYRPGTPYSHESGISKIVTARPFAGSEID